MTQLRLGERPETLLYIGILESIIVSEREKQKQRNALLLSAILIIAYLLGHGILLLAGLSSVHGEKPWNDHSQYDDFSENNTRIAELYVNYSAFYLLHREIVIQEDVKWLFSGEIRLLDNSESQSRRFRFYYENLSNGYMSHPVYFDYEGTNESNRFKIVFNGITKFYRPGDYVLRVDDLLIGSNITFQGYAKVLVYDETFRMIEDFQNKTEGYFRIMLGLLILVLVLSAWTHFGLVVSWVELKWESRIFRKSAYWDVFSLFVLMFFFDILTTVVGLSHGAWELTDFYRVDMFGGVWFSVLMISGIGFFAFHFRDKGMITVRGHSVSLSFLVYLAAFGIASLLRTFVVSSNLNVVRLIGGEEAFFFTLGAILVIAFVFGVWVISRVLRRRRR